MPKNPWVFDEKSGRYRNTATGKYIGREQMLGMRDKFVEVMKERARELTDRLPNGQEALGPWLLDMRELIKQTYTDLYILARGGRNTMEASDYGRLGYMIRNQYNYLQGFAEDMAAGKLTGPQMGNRASLYVASGTQAYEKASASRYDVALPAYPCDGSSECLGNCKCAWDIQEFDNHIEATWTLGSADHCATCEQRASEWAPLVMHK
jgi:hypothetical protein